MSTFRGRRGRSTQDVRHDRPPSAEPPPDPTAPPSTSTAAPPPTHAAASAAHHSSDNSHSRSHDGRRYRQRDRTAQLPTPIDPPSSAANMLPSQLSVPLPTSSTAQPPQSSAASSVLPDCLICVSPILHHTVASCAHSLQICATCSLRLKLFVKRKKKDSPATIAPSSATPAPSSSASASAAPSAASASSSASSASSSSSASASAFTTVVPAAASDLWECPFCRQAWTRVLFTREMHTEADHTAAMALQGGEWSDCVLDESIQVFFQDHRTKEQFLKLRSVYCPVCEHQPHNANSSGGDAHAHSRPTHTKYFASIQALNRHLQTVHSLQTCEACITTRQVFIHEHEFFTQPQLLYHFQHGSPATSQHGPIDPHPFCQFCNQPFFSSDELYAHLSNQHRTCRFCQSEGSQKWYRNDNALRRHFQKHHFLCEQGDCRHREPDYAAYRDAMSLRAHQLAAHVEKGSLSQAQLKQMARVDLSVGFFDHRLPQGAQQGGRERQGRREDEYKGRVDGPDYAHDEDGEEEAYPSLPSALEQRARQANSNIATKPDKKNSSSSSSSSSSTNPASGSTSMQRSYSQPYGLSGRRFGGEDFPTLSSTPSSAAPAAPMATPPPFANRAGAPPPASDFPTLTQTVKTDKKLRALKEREKERLVAAPTPTHPSPVPYSAAMHPPAPPPRSASATPPPSSSSASPAPPASAPDTRILSHVPLPLPAPAPAADVAGRSKQLIGEIRAPLSADEFDSFRMQSSAYRMGDLSASSYLQFFYGLMRGHDSEGRVEQLLMELIALLPDEAKRKELHGEYAKHKVWEKIAKMKGGKGGAKVEVVSKAGGGGGGGGGVETFQGVPARELKRPVVDDKREREERERTDREEKERELERKREERRKAEELAKADKQEKLRLLREERLKDEAEAEKRERERRDKAEKAKRDEEDRAAEEKRREKEENDKEDADQARQHVQLNGKQPVKPSTTSQPRGATMWTSASLNNGDDDDDLVAFPSATTTLGSYSSTSSLTDPALIDVYLGNINQLSSTLPHNMLASLHYLANMLLTITSVLSARHPPSLLSPSLRRFHPSDDTRKRLFALAARLRLGAALEFGRALTQLGVLPQSTYMLSQSVSLWRRQGGALDGGGDEVRGVCDGMTSGELVVMYEWLHAVLAKLTDERSEDVQAAIERQRRKGDKEVTVDGERRMVPLKKDEEAEGDERKGGSASAGGAAEGKKKKGGKQLLFYGGSGLSGVS